MHFTVMAYFNGPLLLISCAGFMYSADADGRGRKRTDADGRGWTRTDADIFIKLYIYFFSIESTTQIAQLRWRNVANVGMVAVGTTTLAQRRHGRRRHNYGGATSFSQRWANVLLQPYANDVGHVGKNKK